MTIVQINTFPHKATGTIMMNLHKVLLEKGYDSYVVWGRGRAAENKHEIVISDDFGVKLHGVYTRLTDRTGFASKRATGKLLLKLDRIKPDVIHLHNLHGYYINIEMLFDYIRENNIKVVWTLHDCWAFTGHCAWFDMCGCEKWKTGCNHCEQLDTYPVSIGWDNSSWNWKKKKELFTGLDIGIVTPSKWLADLVKQSFLKEYPVSIIYNGIDLEVFERVPIEGMKEKYELDDRPVVLGVASEWTPRKGLNDFIELSKKMKNIQFAVVGLTDRQRKEIPDTLVGIRRTDSPLELASLYSLADVFFNPTYEDNFPTTNLEALACGTPVVTYDTGGSPEVLELPGIRDRGGFGKIIKKVDSKTVDYNEVEDIIQGMVAGKSNKNNKSIYRRELEFIDMETRLAEYLRLYE
jgi:glycosyltransferase involved in cell wall biosynthesis